MGYTTNPQKVRVDIWKGYKWYTTISLTWNRFYEVEEDEYEHIRDTFKRLMQEQYTRMFKGMIATCLKPYHQISHPLMIKIDEK